MPYFRLGIPAFGAFRHRSLSFLVAPGIAEDCDSIRVAKNSANNPRVDHPLGGRQSLSVLLLMVSFDALEIDLQCDIDLNGFFGLKPVSPGLSNVKISYQMESEADSQTLQEVLDASKLHSPVFESMNKPVEISAMISKR